MPRPVLEFIAKIALIIRSWRWQLRTLEFVQHFLGRGAIKEQAFVFQRSFEDLIGLFAFVHRFE